MSDETKADRPAITPRDNGPLLVKNLKSLRNSNAGPLETKATMALCRCGKSGRKPFCDGSHSKAGFSSENESGSGENATPDRWDEYDGDALILHDNRKLCAHAGICTDQLREVFGSGREPWIDPNAAPSEALRDIVRKCPSGALNYSEVGEIQEDFDREPEITVSKNGPYNVVGGIELETEHWIDDASREHYALCRCGASRNKPFCDGSHWGIEFSAE